MSGRYEPLEQRGYPGRKEGGIDVVLAAGLAAVWLTNEVRVFGLVMLPTAIVASLLVLYFDWRARWMRRVRTEHDAREAFDKAA